MEEIEAPKHTQELEADKANQGNPDRNRIRKIMEEIETPKQPHETEADKIDKIWTGTESEKWRRLKHSNTFRRWAPLRTRGEE